MKEKPKFERHKAISFRSHASPHDMQAVVEIVSATGFFNSAEVDIAVELVEDRLAFGGLFDSNVLFHLSFAAEPERSCPASTFLKFLIALRIAADGGFHALLPKSSVFV